MADEKKPKIDLKARLGKAAAPAPAPTPAPVPVVSPSGRPMPMPASVPAPPRSQPPPRDAQGIPIPVASAPAGLPIPTPSPFKPSGLDPSNPLAAAMAPAYGQRQAPAAARPAEPQRIEFDDLTVQQASRGGLKKGVAIGAVFAVLVGGVGYTAGGALEQSAGRANAKAGAVDLANGATKARDDLKTLAEKMEAGRKELITEHKFPDKLANELGAVNVSFDGTQLAGRRFSGFSTDTTRDLVEFITAVQGVNDKKILIQSLLTQLKAPITEQLKVPEGQIQINYVVAVDKDPAGNVAGFLSRLAEPIKVQGQSITLPGQFTFQNPGGAGNTQLPAFAHGDIGTKPAAIYIVPKTFDKACPSATGGQIAQLGAQIGTFINELKGEGGGDQNTVTDAKPGLIERADKLVKELGTVGS